MRWTHYLVETRTGRKGARLNVADGGSWDKPLNGIESGSITVSKDQLRGIGREWWGVWRGSILACIVEDDGTETPWVAGPIIQPPSETREMATLEFKGIGALLERRVVIARDYGQPGSVPNDMVYLAKSQCAYRGMSLGTIAQDIVKLCTDKKLGGTLPIGFGSPRETGSGLNQRTYEGFNLANNGLFKRLTEITRVINGPDIAFRPEWANDDHTAIQWTMYHGTSRQPTISQAWTMDLDTTSARSPVASVAVSTDAGGMTNRVYQTGAGEGVGTLIRMSQDDKSLQAGMPLLETVGSTSDSENAALLVAHADAKIAAGKTPVTQISVSVDGSDGRAQIGRWQVGDAARLTLGNDWLTVPAGTTEKRIIAAKGNWNSLIVDIEFQDDGPVEYEEAVN